MKLVVQRVKRACVTVDGTVCGEISHGFLLFVGIAKGDTVATVVKAAKKIAALRVFADDAGKMNRSIADAGGQILSISQFTLLGDVSGGNRPSFTGAMPGPEAEPLFDAFNFELSHTHGLAVSTGVFGAHMDVELTNDGPVTILIELSPE
ncbi:MAG TPA: D-tyrosyl-tRNA(Tyr) deacylase [Acholeplasmatales bacterium]|nr:MAG: D-tyrosyl-tRNA(Tyr) deacylase [Tenericutes bacterium GWF2_57_13]HAQ56062.1 D-tyrosyl-tRNA(Tyr) deacylase [Acholeplasmatales bacterium]